MASRIKAEMKCGNWLDDLKAESVMDQLKIAYKVGNLLLKDVNWKLTDENVGRLGRIVSQDTIDEYAIAMLDGDAFPRPVAIKTKEGVIVAAGVHRVKATKEAGYDGMSVYYADAQLPLQRLLLSIQTNRKEGVRTGREETLANAVYMVLEHGMSVKDVCKHLNLKQDSVTRKLRIQNIKKAAVDAGFRGRVPDTAYDSLYKISDNEKVLKATLDLIESAKIPGTECASLCNNIKKAKTEAQQLTVVEIEGKRRHVEKNGEAAPIKLRIRTVFLKQLHGLARIVEGKTCPEDLQVASGGDEYKKVTQECRSLCAKLKKLFS